MWHTRKDRDCGGPVLRDPMANPNRSRTHPYASNFQTRQPNHNGSFNDHDNFRSPANQMAGDQPMFPPVLEEAIFPPTQPTQLFQQNTAPLLPLLGFNSGVINTQIDGRAHESLVPIMSAPTAALPFNNGNFDNSSLNFQPPSQILPPPVSPLLPKEGFFNQSHSQSFFSGPSSNFDNNFHHFEPEEPRQTLNLQPQWSVSMSDQDQIPRSSLHGNTELRYDRRPNNSNNQQNNVLLSVRKNSNSYEEGNAGQGFERRPNFHHQPSQSQRKPQMLDIQPKRSASSFYETDMSSNSKFGQSRTSSTVSYPSTHCVNAPEERASSFESHSQHPIPSLMSRNVSSGFPAAAKRNNVFEYNNKKQGGKQQFQNSKRPMPFGGSSTLSSNKNGNNITITPNKPKSGPLLPTPKLIPYPPPPLNPRLSSNASPTALLRHPRGILKNSSSSSSYSNFVRESQVMSSNENSPSAVVPYQVGEDDDDDEDGFEFVPDVKCSDDSSSKMTHDFFSEKMVQHFASILTGKPIEEQLDGLLKYLVLPADFLATRVSIVRNLHVMLAETFKNCVLQPYGADFIGIGNSDDSVNVFVDLTGKQGPSSQIDSRVIEPLEVTKENLDELLNLIQEDKNHKFFGQIVRRTNFSSSRITLPVISFIHSETKVRCSIRLDNYLVVQEAKIIQFVCSLDVRIPSLLALARYWSSVHKVLDTPEEDTKNRFVSLLMLFHLARRKIIPTFAHLQSLSVKREYFNNLEIGFCDDYTLVPQNENPALEDKTVFTLSTLSLLKEFFQLFGTAKLKEEVVSLWKAEFIPKENFSPELDSKVLSPDLRKRYRYGVNGKLRNKRLDCSSKLCIQDFQDLGENLSVAVAEYDVNKFQVECKNACTNLESIMSGGSSIMELFVISEYASFGTAEHRDIHKLVYFLFNIAEDREKRNIEL